MGYVRGFDATVTVNGTEIVTASDVSFGKSREKIAIETFGADKVRYIKGMETGEYSLTVLAGTDPEGGADGYSLLSGLYDSGTTFAISFSGGGATITEDVFIESFKPTAPVKGAMAATVTFACSGEETEAGAGSGG